MNVLLFLILLIIFIAILYYVSMFRNGRKKHANRFFWTAGISSIIYGILFNGILDRIFLVAFAIFIVFAKFFMYMVES